MRKIISFFREVRDFFSVLFGKDRPDKTVGFLRKPSTEDEDDNRPKGKMGFRK